MLYDRDAVRSAALRELRRYGIYLIPSLLAVIYFFMTVDDGFTRQRVVVGCLGSMGVGMCLRRIVDAATDLLTLRIYRQKDPQP